MKIRKASVQLDTDEYLITTEQAIEKGIEVTSNEELLNRVCGVIMKVD